MKAIITTALFLLTSMTAYADTTSNTPKKTVSTPKASTHHQAVLTPQVSALNQTPNPLDPKKPTQATQKTVNQAAIASPNAPKKTIKVKANPSTSIIKHIPKKENKIVLNQSANQKSLNTQEEKSKPKPKITENPKTNTPDTAETENHQSGVVLQVGAFRTDRLADSQVAKVSLLGVPAKIVKIKDAEGNVMRVVRSRQRLKQAEAEKAVGRLEKNNVPVLLLN